jgi:acyl-CoA synthetase (AMP-forming)/AMP-acid ligase II
MDRVAAMLAGLGARAGERIGMLVGNRVEFLELFFGAMRIGAIPVILNTRLAADMLSAIFAEAGCRIAVIDPGCSRHAIAVAEGLPLTHRVALDHALADFSSARTRSRPAPPCRRRRHDAQAFQPYTRARLAGRRAP